MVRRFVLSLVCVPLSACGLERDWAAWQDLGPTNGDLGASETGPASTGSTSTSESGAASSGGGNTAYSSETGHAEASMGESPGSTGSTGTTMGETGGTVETTGAAAVCGDGVVAGEEECDDPGDTACFNCARDRLVFVTSRFDFRGDFSLGPQSLDYWCNHLATLAGLVGPDKEARFKPWISTSEGSAAERLHHSKGRYVLRNGKVFALSWDALVAGELLNPLNVDEMGVTQKVPVWTDTNPDGSAMPGTHCNDWGSADFDLSAHFGYSPVLDGQWTFYTADPGTNPTFCGNNAAIYCFESP